MLFCIQLCIKLSQLFYYNIILPLAGEITLVAMAPLTNVAVAIKLDPEFGKKLKDVTIMGGNTEGM